MQIQATKSLLQPTPLGAMRLWPRRRWLAAIAAAALFALFIGVPTGVVPSSLYHRMTPTTWWDYPVWSISAVLAGLTVATYIPAGGPKLDESAERLGRRSLWATVFAGLAVGCPICNKVVVALVGISGALNYWAPMQPLLGVLSLGLLAAGLMMRIRGEIGCRRRLI